MRMKKKIVTLAPPKLLAFGKTQINLPSVNFFTTQPYLCEHIWHSLLKNLVLRSFIRNFASATQLKEVFIIKKTA